MKEATINLNSSSDDKENLTSTSSGVKTDAESPKSTPKAKKSADRDTKSVTSPNTSRKRSSSRKVAAANAKHDNPTDKTSRPDPKPASASTPSKKRTASTRDMDEKEADDAASEVSTIDIDESAPFHIRWDCNQLRRRIKTYVTNGDLNQTQLQNKLGVSPNSYRSFMNAKGPQGGIESNTFAAAHLFFAKREDRGYKQPRAKRRKTSEADVKKSNVDGMPTINGEKEGTVKIYDTCDDIRTKITNHLKKTNLTKVALAKELSKCQGRGEPDITGAGISKFQQKSGPLAGNSNRVFYAAYVFFEKLRLKDGKAKSKKRTEMEKAHGAKGVMTDRPIETVHFKTISGDSVYIDKYGKICNTRGT